ncbi:hypothetical protein ACIA8C_39280 [Nocardia sp. NPDC051321]|uniref:hypothetical protein n=1 Tax=Nocardia sp. NPDC051321 TaxID=3364323 RepID=UPI0037A3F512
MDTVLYNLTTAALFVLLFAAARTAVRPETIPHRRIPWAATALTVIAVAAVLTQLLWSGAMGALDGDPGKSGWWRPLTSVFMQNGGVSGAIWNLVTLAVIAVLAEWLWGAAVMLALFLVGALVPGHLDALFGLSSVSADPRNFAGSSGATYFLGATAAAVLLLSASSLPERLRSLAAPVAGMCLWLAQDNAHGLVVVYGYVLGVVAWLALRAVLPDRHAGSRKSVGDVLALLPGKKSPATRQG